MCCPARHLRFGLVLTVCALVLVFVLTCVSGLVNPGSVFSVWGVGGQCLLMARERAALRSTLAVPVLVLREWSVLPA